MSESALIMKPSLLPALRTTFISMMPRNKKLSSDYSPIWPWVYANVLMIEGAGTITRNEKVISHIYVANRRIFVSGKGYDRWGTLLCDNKKIELPLVESSLYLLAQAICLFSTNSSITSDDSCIGKALSVLAEKMGITQQDIKSLKKIDEISLDSINSFALRYESKGKILVFITGSPEDIAQRSVWNDRHTHYVHELQNQGLQTLAFAYKECDLIDGSNLNALRDFNVLGICGIEDAIRPEVIPAIKRARKAGFQVVMTTPLPPRTAIAIAKQVGLYNEGDEVLDGLELDGTPAELLQEHILHVTIYSTFKKVQKNRILKAFYVRGLIVSDTEGTLGLGTILKRIEEGRHLIKVAQRLTLFFMTLLITQLLIGIVIAMAAFSGPTIFPPICVEYLAWFNLMSLFFMVILANAKKESSILFEDRWQQKWSDIGLRMLKISILGNTLSIVCATITTTLLFAPYNKQLASTMSFVVLNMLMAGHAWNCRITSRSSGRNKSLILALFLGGIGLGVLVEMTLPLNPYQWIFALGITMLYLLGQRVLRLGRGVQD